MSQISLELSQTQREPIFLPKKGSPAAVFTQHVISVGVYQSKNISPNPVIELHMIMSDGNKREFFYSSLEDLNRALISLGLRAVIEE